MTAALAMLIAALWSALRRCIYGPDDPFANCQGSTLCCTFSEGSEAYAMLAMDTTMTGRAEGNQIIERICSTFCHWHDVVRDEHMLMTANHTPSIAGFRRLVQSRIANVFLRSGNIKTLDLAPKEYGRAGILLAVVSVQCSYRHDAVYRCARFTKHTAGFIETDKLIIHAL